MEQNQSQKRTPLMASLKQETDLLHTQLEKLPLFTALSKGVLPLETYVNQLRAFATIFGTLEHETAAIPEPNLQAVKETGESRFTCLLRDLAYFGTTMIPEISAVKHHADAMAARIRLLGAENPVSLIGYLYVLQGTMLGNQVHLSDVQRTYSIENGFGAAFYGGYGERTAEQWGIFVSQMNSIEADDETTGLICQAAREAFGFLYDIHAELFPLPAKGSMTLTATSLNPEAGNHAVPADEREIAAAVTAGTLCRGEFPYFDDRYGDRGKRYASSDTAWLATLASLPAPIMIAQVAWLGGVLASRGMPRITLERQLWYLHKDLVKAVPEKQPEYDQLLVAVSWLEKERLAFISAEAFTDLSGTFAARTGNELNGTLKGTGMLIVSAVCDEKAGIAAAVTSIESWLCDTERFATEWCAAVKDTINQARSCA